MVLKSVATLASGKVRALYRIAVLLVGIGTLFDSYEDNDKGIVLIIMNDDRDGDGDNSG